MPSKTCNNAIRMTKNMPIAVPMELSAKVHVDNEQVLTNSSTYRTQTFAGSVPEPDGPRVGTHMEPYCG